MWIRVNDDWWNLALAQRISRADGKLTIDFPPLTGEHITIVMQVQADIERIEAALNQRAMMSGAIAWS